MLGGLIPARRLVGVGTPNVENGRDVLGITADELVCVALTAKPQVVDDVLQSSRPK